MKNSFDHSQELSTAEDQCSEHKCATCFEQRGCMYEQYVAAVMRDIEESYLKSN